MKKLFSLLIFFIAFSVNAQIITNVDNLRIRDVEQGLESDKILVIDSGNVVRWIDAIEVDLSEYYTITEVDAFVADLEAGLLERYTKDEVDALLDSLELRLDDYYTKTEVDSIITNINDRVDNIDLKTVTSVDNVTSIKIRGSDIFTNNLETDFAQIADVNKAGFGLISMQSEMKIGLVAKDGTTLLDDVDLSWLASGDLAIAIDDTDPNNPELVFSQGGVEVARIPASTLLAGVARSANLSNYILQFKDGTGAVVYSINLEPLFEDYFTKAEANDRFALGTRTITGTGGLTGGGSLTANRTISLSTATQNDIAKGVTAHGWGDFKEFGLGETSPYTIRDNNKETHIPNRFIRQVSSVANAFPEFGVGVSMSYSEDRLAQLFVTLSGGGKGLWYRLKNGEETFEEAVKVLDRIDIPEDKVNKWDNYNLQQVADNGNSISQGIKLGVLKIESFSAGDNNTLNLKFNRKLLGDGAKRAFIKIIVSGSGASMTYNQAEILVSTQTFSTINATSSNRETKVAYWEDDSVGHLSIQLPITWSYGKIEHNVSDYLDEIYFSDYPSSIDKNLFTSADVNHLWGSGNLKKGINSDITEGTEDAKIWSGTTLRNNLNKKSGKTENNIFSGNNTFTKPVKVPMATNSNEAVNLAQLTASNPIALNKIVGSKNYPIPAIAASTEFPIELDENTAVAVVPANLLPVVGSVAKVTMFMHTTRSIQGGVYKSLVNSTNLGIGKLGTYSTSNQSVSVYVEVEVTLTRTSSTNVSTSSRIREIARANSAAGSVPFFDQTGINTDHAQYAGASDFLTVEIMAQVDPTTYTIRTSPVLIEKIK